MYRIEDFERESPASKELRNEVSACAGTLLRSAKLKLTAKCNLRCYMCSYWKGKEPDLITSDRALLLIDELSELGCMKVHISGGEILLRTDINDIAARACERSMRVNITTNGTLLDKETARGLARAGVRSVAVSIDASSAGLHDRIRGRKGAWKSTIKGLSVLAQAKRRWNPKMKIRINTVVTRHNWRDLPGIIELLADLPVDKLLLIPVDEKNDRRLGLNKKMIHSYNHDIAPDLASRGLETGVFKTSSEAFAFGQSSDETRLAADGRYAGGYYREHYCFVPWLHTFVSANGLVYLCCMTRNRIEPLGDINKSSMRDIFRGERYVKVRRIMRERRLDICEKCDNFISENRRIAMASGLEPGR